MASASPNGFGWDPSRQIRVTDTSKDVGATTYFNGAGNAWQHIVDAQADCFIVTHLTQQDVALFHDWSCETNGLVQVSRYDPGNAAMVVMKPENGPSTLQKGLAEEVLGKVAPMGLVSELEVSTDVPFWTRDGHGVVTSYAECGLMMHPNSVVRALQRGIAPWPAVAFEGAIDCPYTVLQEKAIWWFKASEGAVKVVLLVKMDRSKSILRIERWTERPTSMPDDTTRRSHPWAQAVEIHLKLAERSPNEIIDEEDVEDLLPYCKIAGRNQEIVLWFDDVFLRPPSNVREASDIVINGKALKQYAATVFAEINEKRPSDALPFMNGSRDIITPRPVPNHT